MEKNGIGRPSTISPMIKKIFGYKYVETINVPGIKKDIRTINLNMVTNKMTYSCKSNAISGEKQKIVVTALGKVVTEYLIKHYPVMMDLNFTSKMEDELDRIAAGKRNNIEFLMEFRDILYSWINK